MDSYTYFGEKISLGGRFALPYAFMAVLFALNVIAVPYPMSGTVKIPFILMTLYYWSIYRPTLVPPPLAFCTGLLMDLLSGLPVGLNAALLVAIQWLVSDQRRFLTGQPFIVIWLGFGLLNAFATLLQWGMFGLTGLKWPPLLDLVPSIGLGFVLFPFICGLLNLTHKLLPSPADTALGGKGSLDSQRNDAGL
jgi:rod shape-determining protein MreD